MPNPPRELFLIDGNSLVFRAFFALPESISTSKGFPTSAIFGFASMLVKLISDYGVKPTLVVWDAGMSGREVVYDEYKAGRRERPDLLAEQWPHLHPLVESFGYRNVKVQGYEADDVIATLAREAREQGIEVTIVTGDRDLFQLVEPGVRVMATGRGITDTKIYDRDAILDRYGIPPELIPDFVGLKGDTSDNIPGVPGIGDKTASQLLQQWGDLEGVLSNIDGISGAKRKQNLTEHAEDARISKQLATAQRDIDVDIDLDGIAAREPDRSALRATFREFELRAPLERLEEALGEDDAAPAERVEELIEVEAREVPLTELATLDGELVAIAALRPGEAPDEVAAAVAAFDADAAGALDSAALAPDDPAALAPDDPAALAPDDPVALAPDDRAVLAADDSVAIAEAPPATSARRTASAGAGAAAPATRFGQGSFDFDTAGPRGPLTVAAWAGGDVLLSQAETLAAFVMARGDRPVVAHDWKTIAMADDPCAAPPLEHDTMVAAYLIDPARRGYPLDELAAEAGLGVQVNSGNGVAERAVLTRVLADRQRVRLDEDGLTRLFHEIELPLVDVLVEMERAGIKLDVQRLAEISRRFDERAAELERRVWELAGEEFTIGSPQQLAPILFDKLGLSRKRRGKTGFSTDARVLQAIRHEHEIVPAIEEWREVTKLKSTYLDAFPELVDEHGRLHTTFNQTATTTGRLSSTDPNLQNIPIRTEQGREIRACFVADGGNSLISADYSQVELRLLAHIADEPVLKEIFRRGEDVHTATAEAILGGKTDPGTRSKAKMVNYGIVYGLSAYGLADRLQIEQEEAQQFIDAYLERFPKVKEFIDRTISNATTEGYVSTLFGRIRRVPELRSRQYQTRSLGERLAVNMVIQGTAADIIKVAMVRCRDELRAAGLETKLVLQIHDELLFEGPEAEVDEASEIVRREMAGAFEMDPPLEVDVGAGRNWLEAK
ncbi:MAG TPA: DNA polymerase I [Thermoleophilaceae bacterium]|nr:DNA polymerase I [Thermoleophilaceae bacterium]